MPQLITAHEAAEILKVKNARAVKKLAARRLIPFVLSPTGKQRLFERETLERFIISRRDLTALGTAPDAA